MKEVLWMMCVVTVLSTVASGAVVFDATYDVSQDLTVGSPATGTLLGGASVSGGRLQISANDQGVTYGGTYQYLPGMNSTSWGDGTICSVVRINDSGAFRKTILSVGPAYDGWVGMVFWADMDDHSGPTFQMARNSWVNIVNSQLPASVQANTDYFMAVSWHDTGTELQIRMYCRKMDGTGTAYAASTSNANYGHMTSDFETGLNIRVGSRLADSDNLRGNMDSLRMYNTFADTQGDFDALFTSAMPTPTPTTGPTPAPVLEATYNVNQDLTVGFPATGTLLGGATVSDGRLWSSAADQGVTYGETYQYLPSMNSTSWGDGTICSVVRINDLSAFRKAILSVGPTYDGWVGMVFFADTDDQDGPVFQMARNSWVNIVNSQLPASVQANTDYFMAASWHDTGTELQIRMYCRKMDGTGTSYAASTSNANYGRMTSDFDTGLNIRVGSRLSNSDSLRGGMDLLRIYDTFANTQGDFDALFFYAQPEPTPTPTPTPTDGPTPTPCPFVGLSNGDFEADDIGGLGQRVQMIPSNWNGDPADGFYVDFLETWCTSNNGRLSKAGYSGIVSLWQNVGGMIQDHTYYINFVYASYTAGDRGNVKLYAGYGCAEKGGELIYTSPALNCAPANTFKAFETWYTCDAAHAGKSLTLSFETIGNSGDLNIDNVTVVAFDGPTPTLTPTPTPSITPTPSPTPVPGLRNGSFENPPTAPDPDNNSYNVIPADWTAVGSVVTTQTQSAGIHKAVGWAAADGVQVAVPGLIWNSGNTRLWQNTRLAMVEGTVYTVNFSVTRMIGATGGGFDTNVWLTAANDVESRGAIVSTSENLFWDVTPDRWHMWTPRSVSFTCDSVNAGKFLGVELGGSYANPAYDKLSLTIATPVTIPVTLLDYAPVDPQTPIAIKAKIWDASGNVVSEEQATLAGVTIDGDVGLSGTYTTLLPEGTYYAAVKSYQHVQRVIEVVKGAGALTTDEVRLEAGDLHGDNEVFFTSLSIVLKWFGTGGDGYPVPE